MSRTYTQRKQDYFKKVARFLSEFTKVMVVQVDNVGSSQLQNIRKALRGKAEILMGKNTMIRKAMSDYATEHPEAALGPLIARVRGNVGLVFTNSDLSDVRKRLEENRVPAPAKAGAAAPNNVNVPPGPTGCDPSMTGFFQALNIPTKITKGQIEITNEVPLVRAGEKVTPGAAAVLAKLNIRPFTYGLVLQCVFEAGSVFDPAVLDITPAEIISRFMSGVRAVAAIGLATNIPNAASVPHSIAGAFKACVAVLTGEGVTYKFKYAEAILHALANPGAFAAAAAPAAAATTTKAAAPVEEKKEEEPVVAVTGLFGSKKEGY